MSTFRKPAAEFVDLPVVKEHIAAAAEMLARRRATDFTEETEYCLASGNDFRGNPPLAFDSPLEVLFWVWFRAVSQWSVILGCAVLKRHVFVNVEGQTYNLDFVVESDRGPGVWPLIAIELDGHAFHEKTLEQVTARDQRDRALQRAGWHLFHFSWAEFTARPYDSVWEIVQFIIGSFRENPHVHPRD